MNKTTIDNAARQREFMEAFRPPAPNGRWRRQWPDVPPLGVWIVVRHVNIHDEMWLERWDYDQSAPHLFYREYLSWMEWQPLEGYTELRTRKGEDKPSRIPRMEVPAPLPHDVTTKLADPTADECRLQGWWASRLKIRKNENPYDAGGMKAAYWDAGFDAAKVFYS